MSDDANKDAGAPTTLVLLQELIEAQRLFLESEDSSTDGKIAYNEGAASLYQKLLVLDGATIALSITFLGGLLSLSGGGHPMRHPSMLLVCVGWILLLGSMYSCWHYMISLKNSNAHMLKAADALRYHVQSLLLAFRTGSALGPTAEMPSSDVESIRKLSEHFLRLTKEQWRKHQEAIDAATKSGRKEFVLQQTAFWCTAAGLILLCIFALKTFLEM